MQTLRNFTPHPLTLHAADGSVLTLLPDGPAPRLAVTRESLGSVCGLTVTRAVTGAAEGLPHPQEGVVLVVSAMVADACPERADLASPGEAVKRS